MESLLKDVTNKSIRDFLLANSQRSQTKSLHTLSSENKLSQHQRENEE